MQTGQRKPVNVNRKVAGAFEFERACGVEWGDYALCQPEKNAESSLD
jgi:hypothetical protein